MVFLWFWHKNKHICTQDVHILNKATWMSVKESDFGVVDNNPEMDLNYLWLLPDKKKNTV